MKKKSLIVKCLNFCAQLMLILAIILAFYKLPAIIANKISYHQLKNRNLVQDLPEDE